MYFTLELNRLLRRVYRSGFFVCVPLLFLVVCLLAFLYPARNISHVIIYSACGVAYIVSSMGSLIGPIAVLEEEFTHQTWDFQRTSAVSPSALVFGKVIGGCASFWYTYLVSSAALVIAVIQSPNPTHVSSAARAVTTVGVMMVFSSTFGLVLALERLRNMRESGRDPSSSNPHLWRIIAIVPILLLHWIVWSLAFYSRGAPPSLSWYGSSFSSLVFLSISLLAWSAVSVGIAIRLLRDELQYRQYPIVFPAVCLLISTYFAGFVMVPSPHVVHRICLVLFILSIPACLLLVPSGGKAMLKLGVFLESVRTRRWESAFRFLPLVAWPLLFLFVSFLIVELTVVHRMRGIPTMITLLLIRDLSFGLGLFLSGERRYRFFGLPFLTFLAIMYVALPVLASKLGLSPLVPYIAMEGPDEEAARMPKIVVTLLEGVLALIFAVTQAKREIYSPSAREG